MVQRDCETAGDLLGAAAALRRADERGHAAGAYELAVLLHQQQWGDPHRVAAVLRRADERGHAAAASELGRRLKERGDLERAEAAYVRAVEAGDFQVAQQASAAHKSLRRNLRP